MIDNISTRWGIKPRKYVTPCSRNFERVCNLVDVIQSLEGTLSDDMHFPDELPAWAARGGYTEE